MAAGKESGARVSSIGWRERLQSWWLGHRLVAIDSLRRFLAQPLGSGMTCLVIGIALALPVTMYMALANVQALGERWDGDAHVEIFLKNDLSDADALRLRDELARWVEVQSVTMISREQGLAEFQRLSGMAEALGQLEKNPLPVVLDLVPATEQPEQTETLLQRLQALPQADRVQLDLQWVKRLHALVTLGQRMVLMLVLLLSLGVLLVIGNTIRLEIENRRREIIVTKLVGGTDSFIRRPFLYAGFWYGLGGGWVASVITGVGLALLDKPVAVLAGLYDSDFSLLGLTLADTVSLWMLSALLGFFGAWFSVGRHLDAIEPA